MILKMSINSRNKSNGKLEVDVNIKIRYICPDHLSQVSLLFYSSLLSFPFILLLHPTVKAFQAWTDYCRIER